LDIVNYLRLKFAVEKGGGFLIFLLLIYDDIYDDIV